MDIDGAFARTVRRELARRRLTVPDLADLSKISERTLYSILSEDGQRTVKLWHVCRISQALGVPCAEMVARADALVDHQNDR